MRILSNLNILSLPTDVYRVRLAGQLEDQEGEKQVLNLFLLESTWLLWLAEPS